MTALGASTTRAGTVAGAAAVTYYVAGQAAGANAFPAAALTAAVACVALFLRPKAGVVAALALGATIFPFAFLPLNVGGIQTDAVELLVLALVGIWIVGILSGMYALPGPLFFPVILIPVCALVAASWSVWSGSAISDTLGPLKTFAMYLLAPAVAAFFPKDSRAQLERVVIALATLGCLYTVWLAATGQGLPFAANYVSDEVSTLGSSTTALRIRLDVLALVFLATLLVLGRALLEGFHWWRISTLALFLTVIALSFNRSTWFPLALTLLLLSLLRPGSRAPLRGFTLALVSFGLLLVAVVGAQQGLLGSTAKAVTARAASGVDASVTREGSYQERVGENRAAVAAIRESPVFGTGLNRPYGARVFVYRDNPPRFEYIDRLFIHNQYLGIWLQLGLLGILVFAWLGWAVSRAAAAAVRTADPQSGTVALASALCVLGFAMQAWFQTSLLYRPSIMTVSVALALLYLSLPAALAPSGRRSHAIPAMGAS